MVISQVMAAEETGAKHLTMLKQDSGKNFSEMNVSLYSAVTSFGDAGLNMGETVKFTAPRPGWKLKAIQIVGWSGFNNTTKRFPADRNFLLEVRDADLNVLYKFADTQNMYFASPINMVASGLVIPAIPVTGDFYIIFYDRGSMRLGMENDNGTGNSFLFVNGRLAEFRNSTKNETIKVNWLIRAIGE